MIAVIDVSIFVSALMNPRGRPAQLINAWRRGRFELVISEHILSELETVLRRSRIRRYTGQSERESVNSVEELRRATMVSPQATVEVPGISPADAAYLAAAVVGHADYLVTGDRGLLALRQFQGTRIVSAVEFLVELQLEGRV